MNIPGITDSNVEIFAVEYPKCMATYNGGKVGFWELPSGIISCVEDMVWKDKEALMTFKEEGVTDWRVIVETWAWCNLGRFDVIPDVETETGCINLEHHNCGCRGKCPWEFRRCKRLTVNGEILRPREIKYLMLLTDGLSDRDIAKEMNQKPSSMISLARDVRDKLRVKNRAGLTSWAVRMMI
jgi:DNA-binding CsgD family transcriptional regulator